MTVRNAVTGVTGLGTSAVTLSATGNETITLLELSLGEVQFWSGQIVDVQLGHVISIISGLVGVIGLIFAILNYYRRK